MYIVYAQGVYRHTIAGIFDDIEKAKKAAILEAISENDGYHHFYVAESELNEYVDDIKDLFYVTSTKIVKDIYGKWNNPPLSRDICIFNEDGELLEVVLQMTVDTEKRTDD